MREITTHHDGLGLNDLIRVEASDDKEGEAGGVSVDDCAAPSKGPFLDPIFIERGPGRPIEIVINGPESSLDLRPTVHRDFDGRWRLIVTGTPKPENLECKVMYRDGDRVYPGIVTIDTLEVDWPAAHPRDRRAAIARAKDAGRGRKSR